MTPEFEARERGIEAATLAAVSFIYEAAKNMDGEVSEDSLNDVLSEVTEKVFILARSAS